MESARETNVHQESDESLAAQYEISFDGRRYTFRQHHYDLFRDALHYAVAEHARIGSLRDDAFHPSWAAAYRPSDEDERMIKLHGIACIGLPIGMFCSLRLASLRRRPQLLIGRCADGGTALQGQQRMPRMGTNRNTLSAGRKPVEAL